MFPMNNAQMEAVLRMQQMQQMQQIFQIQQVLHTNQMRQNFPPPHQQQQHENDTEDNEDDEIIRTLFCTNIDERVDEEILYELFVQAGPLNCVRIPGQRKFAFIEYTHACSPPYAMNLFNGISLFGKRLVLKYQGKTAPPPLLRRILPPDWGVNDRKSKQGANRGFDNSALRMPHFNPFSDDIGTDTSCRNRNVSADQSLNGRRNDNRDSGRRDRMERERLHNSSGSHDRRQEHSRERDRSHDRDQSRNHDRSRDRHYDDRRNNSHRHFEKRSSYI